MMTRTDGMVLRSRGLSARLSCQSVALLASLVAGSGDISAAPIALGNCVPLERPPAWVFYGAWDSDDNLILVDSLNSRVHRYTAQGRRLRDVAGDGISLPSLVHRRGAREYFIENEDGELSRFEDWKLKEAIDLVGAYNDQHGRVGSVWGWALAGSDVITFSDLEKAGRWYSAFLRIPLGNPNDFQVLHRMEINNPARNFYLLGSPYITTLNDTAYLLIMEEKPFILRAERKRSAPLRIDLSTWTGRRPQLPEKRGIESVKPLFRRLEESKMPAGLFGWQDSLYLLMRRPIAGGSAWALVKMDPAGKEIFSKPLLSKANHLVVIPGESSWAVLQKGPVLGLGEQTVETLCLIPSDEL